MIKQHLRSRGQVYSFLTWGQPDTEAWLFLHGFMGSQSDFVPVAQALTGYRISLNLLGFGSQPPAIPPKRLTMTAQIRDLADLLTQLQVKKVNLVGYSMGGRLALGFALARPDLINHLYLESSTAGIADAKRRRERQLHDQKLARYLRCNDLASFVDQWEQLPLFASQHQLSLKQQQLMRQQRLMQNPINLAHSLEKMGTGSQPNFWPQLAHLAVKVTLITGQLDQKFSLIGEKLQRMVPVAQWIIVPKVGHNVHFEAPATFATILKGNL